jgi:hypothetical protein
LRSWLFRFRCSPLLWGRIFLCFFSLCFAMAPTGRKSQQPEAVLAATLQSIAEQSAALEAAQAAAGTIQPAVADEARSHLS